MLLRIEEAYQPYKGILLEETESEEGSESEDFFGKFIKTTTKPSEPYDELTVYLEEPLEPLKTRASLLSYWGKKRIVFPCLFRMARDYLACPASSSPSERQFSLAGNVQTKKRNRMNTQSLEAMVLLNNWQLKSEFFENMSE